MYNLYAPLVWKPTEQLTTMLNKVLGYTIEEIKQLELESFDRNIVINISVEEAKAISEIFLSNKYTIYLNDENDKTIFWNNIGITINKSIPIDYNLSQPIITRDHLADLTIPKKVVQPIMTPIFEQPKPKCPTCGSTNIKKISSTKRWLSTGIFGLASSNIGKTMVCGSCGYKW